jgi:2,3-dihydroxyphenylpropionate 1,2-dioxygenase
MVFTMGERSSADHVYVACVPHTPLVRLQDDQRGPSNAFWTAYDARVAEFATFDPELVIIFGSDHYSNLHLNLMPSFLIGHGAHAIDDCGGFPGKLDVPSPLSVALSNHLVAENFDIATSYAMKVDHGFSSALSYFLHNDLAARPVIPIFINAVAEPRPSLRRCRELGEAIGAWAAQLGKRVAFIGSGGLSHFTGRMFPQFHSAPTDEVRHYIVHGGSDQGIPDEKWHGNISVMCRATSDRMVDGDLESTVSQAWDLRFLDAFGTADMTCLDDWDDADIVREGGEGASEIRMWIAAVAAGQAAGGGVLSVDYYSGETSLGVGAAVAHIAPGRVVSGNH